jgi:hypothetical protein
MGRRHRKSDGKIRKSFVHFYHLLRCRGSGTYLRYPETGSKLSLIDDPNKWNVIAKSSHSCARNWLADLPEEELPGKTKKEDYEIVRQMIECFERRTILPPRKQTNKKGRKK